MRVTWFTPHPDECNTFYRDVGCTCGLREKQLCAELTHQIKARKYPLIYMIDDLRPRKRNLGFALWLAWYVVVLSALTVLAGAWYGDLLW